MTSAATSGRARNRRPTESRAGRAVPAHGRPGAGCRCAAGRYRRTTGRCRRGRCGADGAGARRRHWRRCRAAGVGAGTGAVQGPALAVLPPARLPLAPASGPARRRPGRGRGDRGRRGRGGSSEPLLRGSARRRRQQPLRQRSGGSGYSRRRHWRRWRSRRRCRALDRLLDLDRHRARASMRELLAHLRLAALGTAAPVRAVVDRVSGLVGLVVSFCSVISLLVLAPLRPVNRRRSSDSRANAPPRPQSVE